MNITIKKLWTNHVLHGEHTQRIPPYWETAARLREEGVLDEEKYIKVRKCWGLQYFIIINIFFGASISAFVAPWWFIFTFPLYLFFWCISVYHYLRKIIDLPIYLYAYGERAPARIKGVFQNKSRKNYINHPFVDPEISIEPHSYFGDYYYYSIGNVNRSRFVAGDMVSVAYSRELNASYIIHPEFDFLNLRKESSCLQP